MNKYLEKIAFEFLYHQAKDADVEKNPNHPDYVSHKGKVIAPEDSTTLQKLHSDFFSVKSNTLTSGKTHAINSSNGNLMVELIAEKTEKRNSPVAFGWEGKAKFGKYPSAEHFSSALRTAVKKSPLEIPEEHVQSSIDGYSSFLKKRRLKMGAIGVAGGAAIAGAAYGANKYLNKAAETVPVEGLSPEQLKQLFANFQQLPADGPAGQPGANPFYGSVKLSEGIPEKREHRNTAYGNSTPVEGNNSDEYQYEFQRAFPRG